MLWYSVWESCSNLIIPSVSLFQIGYTGVNGKFAELYLVWRVSQWGQSILCTESFMGSIISSRFCTYGKPEGFQKGYQFSTVFRVTRFFSKSFTPYLPLPTKNPNLSKRPTSHLENGVMKLFALIRSTAHKMAVQYYNKMLVRFFFFFFLCSRAIKMYAEAVADKISICNFEW